MSSVPSSSGGGPIALCKRYVRGQLPAWVVLRVLMPVYTVTVLVTPLVAASQFPGDFDFRHRVITNLASWRDNPSGHRFFGVGLGIAALLLVPLLGLSRNLNGSRTLLRVGAWLGWAGLIAGLVLALESGAVAGMRNLWGLHRRAHEMYAVATFGGVSLWSLCFGLGAVQNALRDGARGRSARILIPTALLVLMVGSTLIHLLLYLQVYSRTAGASGSTSVGETGFWMQFAFWEWVCAASVAALLQVAAWEACRLDRRPPSAEHAEAAGAVRPSARP